MVAREYFCHFVSFDASSKTRLWLYLKFRRVKVLIKVKVNKDIYSLAVPYTSTLRQFQLFRFVGWNRTYLADTVDGNLCWSTVPLLPSLWNSYRLNKATDCEHSFKQHYWKQETVLSCHVLKILRFWRFSSKYIIIFELIVNNFPRVHVG